MESTGLSVEKATQLGSNMLLLSHALCVPFASELRLCPSMFGEPTTRQRTWRICYRASKWEWVGPRLEQLAYLWLCKESPKLSPEIFLIPGLPRMDEDELCPSARTHLDKYLKTDKNFFDLACNPDFALRTECHDGRLMTLTTNTKIWCLAGSCIKYMMS